MTNTFFLIATQFYPIPLLPYLVCGSHLLNKIFSHLFTLGESGTLIQLYINITSKIIQYLDSKNKFLELFDQSDT